MMRSLDDPPLLSCMLCPSNYDFLQPLTFQIQAKEYKKTFTLDRSSSTGNSFHIYLLSGLVGITFPESIFCTWSAT